MKRYFLLIVILLLPVGAEAGFRDIANGLSSWWKKGSIGADLHQDEAPAEVDDETSSGLCQAPKEKEKIVCEVGAGFLCINTPPGGVAEDSFLLRGTIDRNRSTVASIQISVQHDYTKKTEQVDTEQRANEQCWEGTFEEHFCIDAEGRFAARVPLSTHGPATIMVSATRLSGEAVRRVVSMSRVTPLSLLEESIRFTPDIKQGAPIDSKTLTIEVDLLGECSFCDFIGSAAGAVRVTAINTITDSTGAQKRISCSTTTEEGQGRFLIGVPVGEGINELTIQACNPAFFEIDCPKHSYAFKSSGMTRGIDVISPEGLPLYSKEETSTIPWAFRLLGSEVNACVNISLNRNPKECIAADANGIYRVDLAPRAGLNLVSVQHGAAEYAWAFGWGDLLRPKSEEEFQIPVPAAAGVAIPAETFTRVVQPLVSNFLQSDELGELIEQVLKSAEGGNSGGQATAGGVDHAAAIVSQHVKGCSAAGGLKGFQIGLRGTPKIESALLEGMRFFENAVELRLNLTNADIKLSLLRDQDEIPLKVGIAKGLIDLRIETRITDDGQKILLLTSPHQDCDFKSRTVCTGAPTPLIPKHLVGNASANTHFVACDVEAASADVERVCRAINSIDAQTGLFSLKVLDALNNGIVCGGSKGLVGALSSLSRTKQYRVGPIAGFLGPFLLPVGIDLGEGMAIDQEGVEIIAGLRLGDEEFFEGTGEGIGLIADGPLLSRQEEAHGLLRAELSTRLINGLLFLLNSQPEGKGLLDLDLHEAFFEEKGFHFSDDCDIGKTRSKPPALCSIRPRVGELLGTPLVTYGYFPSDQAILMRLRGNRWLAPRIAIVDASGLPVVSSGQDDSEEVQSTALSGSLLELQLGGVQFSFYALEIDEDAPPDSLGNRPLLLNNEGKPMIRSMLPHDPDPYRGQIITFELSLLLAVQVNEVTTDINDPSRFVLAIRPLADRSRLLMTPLPGSNTTTIPDESLIELLRSKINIVLADLSRPEKAVRIPLPKKFDLTKSIAPESLFSKLGLQTIDLRPDGLKLSLNEERSSIELNIEGIIKQLLHRDGQPIEFTLP